MNPIISRFALSLTLVLPSLLTAQNQVSLDVYNRDLACVKDIRIVSLEKGEGSLDFTGVADGMFAHTAQVRLVEKSDRVATRELTFNYDLVNLEKLMLRYIGKWFSFQSDETTYQGRLLSFDDKHLFLQPDTTDAAIQVVERSNLKEMFYPGVPEGLFTQPTLTWRYTSDKAFKDIPVEISYLTTDVTWMCDYRGELTSDTSLVLSSSFVITNDLPLPFAQAKISLVVGKPHRSDDPKNSGAGEQVAEPGVSAGKGTQLAEKIGELYRYELPAPVNLFAHQTVQVPFFNGKKIKVEKRAEFPHLLDEQQVLNKIRFVYKRELTGDAALPEGDFDLYRRTKTGDLTFIGEDFIPITPAGGNVTITLGPTPDVTARRTRMAMTRPSRNAKGETWQVELTNGRSDPVTVLVEQRAFGYFTLSDVAAKDHKDATISVTPVTEEAGRLLFPVAVPSEGKATLTFTLNFGY